MTLASTWIRLGGTTPATEVAPHTPPTYETWADGGNGEASFTFGRSAKFASHLTAPGTLVEILVGPFRVWLGRIGDFDRLTGEVIGRGIQTDALGIPALDGSGDVTRDYGVALATATAAPWNWVAWNTYTGPSVALGDSDQPQMMAALTGELAEQQGARWGQYPEHGGIYILPDPTTPTWTITPEAAAFGPTSEGQATHLVARYFNGSTNETAVRSDPLATVATAEVIDLTERGTLTLGEVNDMLDAQLAATRAQTGWVNGITLHREQITMNGTPACLAEVHARNRMVRAHGLPAAFGAMQATWVDVVLSKTRWTVGSPTIYLEPVKTAPRAFADVLAAA